MDYTPSPVNGMIRGRGLLQSVMQCCFGVAAALLFVFLTIPTLIMLSFSRRTERCRHIVHHAAVWLLRLWGAGPEVRGLEHLPHSACVVVANHASYLDGIILTAVLPPRFGFVIKKEMSQVPLAGFLLRRIGSEFVDRFDSQKSALDVRRILQRALTSESLVFFPEGTFRPEPGLRRFQGGAFTTAYRAGAPLVPVIIRGSRAMLPARRWLPRPGRLQVTILPPAGQPGQQQSPQELLELCRQQILAGLDEPDMMR